MRDFVDAPLEYVSGFAAPTKEPDDLALWFVFHDYSILVLQEDKQLGFPEAVSLEEFGLTPIRHFFLGTLDGQDCYVAELAHEVEPPAGMAYKHLRSLYFKFPEKLFWLVGRAQHLLDWDRQHQYCGRCGTATLRVERDWNKQCPNCNLSHYPRLSPAIIVAVERGDQILLAHSARYRGKMYSVLAGFVEPGESLEETLHREIFEEVGIRVKNVQYFGSQPWPFPNSLMIGFTCEYESGELVLQEEEIADAQWFCADNLPEIPSGISISRKLIDNFVAKQRQAETA